jgi:hypothetical protein
VTQRERERERERRKSVCSRYSPTVLDLLAVCWTNDCAATAAEKLGSRARLPSFAHRRRTPVTPSSYPLEQGRGLSNEESLRLARRCGGESIEKARSSSRSIQRARTRLALAERCISGMRGRRASEADCILCRISEPRPSGK